MSSWSLCVNRVLNEGLRWRKLNGLLKRYELHNAMQKEYAYAEEE